MIYLAPKLSIIVPTYCDAENLPVLVSRIHEAVTQASVPTEIIIVDNNSPVDTQAVYDQLRQTFSLRVLNREESRGLSSAIIAGMKIARGKFVLVMNANLSHPVEKILELVNALDDPDVDFVIGSRFVTGGETDENWGVFRKLNSKISNLLARPLTSVQDPMSEFFCLRRSAFDSVAGELDPIGDRIGLELIVKCGCRNVVEVPISFSAPLHDASKLHLQEQFDFLRQLKQLYEHRFRDKAYFTQFALVGSSGMLVDFSMFALLMNWFPISAARALAIWLAMTWNFCLNRKLTFSYASDHSALKQYFGYCGGCLLGAVFSWLTSVALCTYIEFFAEFKILAAMLGVGGGMISNYLICRHVVFKTSSRKPQINLTVSSPSSAELGNGSRIIRRGTQSDLSHQTARSEETPPSRHANQTKPQKHETV